MPGADRLVRIGVDAQRDAHEDPLDARRSRERGFVGRVEDDGRAFGGRVAEERLALVVPVHDDLVSAVAGRPRERELTGRGDIGSDSLLTEEAEHGDVGEGLRPERDAAVRAHSRAKRPGASRSVCSQ